MIGLTTTLFGAVRRCSDSVATRRITAAVLTFGPPGEAKPSLPVVDWPTGETRRRRSYRRLARPAFVDPALG